MVPKGNNYHQLKHPLVSVVIPNYNGAEWVLKAIESASSQTYAPFEIVVVDDGSRDESVKKMEAWKAVHAETPLHIIQQENKGVCAARNTGAKEARGKFLAFLDSDDLWGAEKLERQMDRILAASPADQRKAFCLCDHTIETLDKRKDVVDVRHQVFHPKGLKEEFGSWPSSWLVARELFDAVEGFDVRMVCSEDTDFQVRCMRAGAVLMNAGYDTKTEPPLLRYFAPQEGKQYKNIGAMAESVKLFVEKNEDYLQSNHPKQYAVWLEKVLRRVRMPAYLSKETSELAAMITERLDRSSAPEKRGIQPQRPSLSGPAASRTKILDRT